MLPYRARRAVTAPRRLVLRRTAAGRHPYVGPMLEAMGYRRSMYRFVQARAENPDLLHDADLGPDDVVIDGGAYEGEWAVPIARRYGCTVHAFEPSPAAAGRLATRAERDGLPIVVHRVALGGADAAVRLALAGPGSAVDGGRADFGAVDAEARDVAAVLDELGIGEVGLLKLNIEGSEFDVLDRLIETGWLPRVRQLSVQFHEWHPHAYRRRRAIRRALRATHEQVWCYPWVWELWRRP